MELKSKFEFFRRNNLIYLDSAATTQAPDQVILAVRQVLEYRGNPHRGAHKVAERNEDLLEEAKENIARFINAGSDEMVFTNNATDSINLAVDAIADQIKKGDEIIVSIAEHHSNLLPYLKLSKKGAVIKIVGIKNSIVNIEEIKNKLSTKTKIVALQHCSNVLGNINPVEKVGAIVKKYNQNIFYFVDGAQAIAHIPVDVKQIKCDFYAFSGHKMYGPDGVGGLYVNKKIHQFISSVRAGGGTVKEVTITYGKNKDTIAPSYISTLLNLEGGTPNTSNIFGLSKAVNFIRSIGFDKIRKHEKKLVKMIIGELSVLDDIEIFGPKNIDEKIGVVAFGLKKYNVKELGDYLNRRRICIRYGSHCAFPLADKLGQESLRISLGCYNDENDIETCLQEIKLFLDKKKGLIKNKNLGILRDKIYYRNILPVNSLESIFSKIKSAIYNPAETEIIIMAGHFLGIPDMEKNKFYPSIKQIMPEKLHKLLDEFEMTSFPIFTWTLGCNLAKKFKEEGIKSKLAIIANDTTGINELRLSDVNKTEKTAEQYRNELIELFYNNSLKNIYQDILKKNKLGFEDVLKNSKEYVFRESSLRNQFKKFIRSNKDYFENVIDYTAGEEEKIDISIGILDNQQIKTCRFDTFQSKTGGKFCIVEVTEFIAELFGKADDVKFDYLSQRILNPESKAKHKIIVMFTPAMCDDAVTRGAELYVKLFLQEQLRGSFKFFNIPLGHDSVRYLATGVEAKYISDKDNLEVLDVEEELKFPDLWRLCEYKLLYNINEYVDEMEKLFNKIGINKKSNLLDTCVGPGFFSIELLEKGYNLKTADKNKYMIEPFERDLKEGGVEHRTILSSWLDLPKHFSKESFDMLFNRGNSIIYAAGGWNKKIKVDKQTALEALRQTFKVYHDLLKPNGYLYIDKFRDSEIPAKKVVARLNIKKTKDQKDIIFYVERKPEDNIRFAQMLLRGVKGKETGLPNMAYDLSEEEMENILKSVGFKNVQKLNLKQERHFVVWLAQK